MLSDCQCFADVGVEHRAACVEVGVGEKYFSDERVIDFDSVLYDDFFNFLHEFELFLAQLDQSVYHINQFFKWQFFSPIFGHPDDFGVGLAGLYAVFALL